MSRRAVLGAFVAGDLVLSLACGSQATAPSPPSGTSNADGSTLKATAPTLQSPINGAVLPQGTPVTLVLKNSTMSYTTSLTLAYHFEVRTTDGTVVVSALVSSGTTTTSYTVTAPLEGNQTYQWRARPESQGTAGPWAGFTSFVAPQNDGYNRPGALFDPLIYGKTVGSIGGSGNITWVPGQGIRMNDDLAYVVYDLPQTYSSGEMSVEVTGLSPGGQPGKARIFSMLDRLGAMASLSRYSFNVQYRGAGGVPDNCIVWKAVLGDNNHAVEATVDRFQMVFILDPSKVYLWQAFWTPTSFRLVVKEGGTTGPVVYDQKADAIPGTSNWNPEKMYAFIGTNNGAFVQNDGTRVGMTLRNLWVGSTPRPTTLGSASAQRR
jgi:hypothetical protein